MKGILGFGKKNDTEKDEKWLVQFDKKTCIGCATCMAICDKHWKLGDDGKSILLESTLNEQTGMFEKTVADSDFESNKMAAEGCPVNCIHIINKETGEKIV